MTVTDLIVADSVTPPAEPLACSDEMSTNERCVLRARFWRLALGLLGLFWVAAMLLLAR